VPTHADLLRMLPGEQKVMLAQFNISLEEAWGRWQSAAPDMQFKNFVTREYWGMVEESGGVPGMEDEDTGGAPDIGGEDTGEGEIGDEELWGPQPRTAAGGGIPWLLVGAAAFFLWPMLKGKRRK